MAQTWTLTPSALVIQRDSIGWSVRFLTQAPLKSVIARRRARRRESSPTKTSGGRVAVDRTKAARRPLLDRLPRS